MLSGSQIKLVELISRGHNQAIETQQKPKHTQTDVDTIEELLEQIQKKEERLRELNTERNSLHKSLRELREQLDTIMNRLNLEVIVKNRKEYYKK